MKKLETYVPRFKTLTEVGLPENLDPMEEFKKGNNYQLWERPCFLQTKNPREKDKVEVLNNNHEKAGIKFGDVGEIFLADHNDEKAFVLFFDSEGFCRCGEILFFNEFSVIEHFDDYDELLSLLGED